MVELKNLVIVDIPEEPELDFEGRLRRLSEKYLHALPTALNVASFQADVWAEVHRLYAEGSYICDEDGEPVLDIKDVQVRVNSEGHGPSASVLPSEEWLHQKLVKRVEAIPELHGFLHPPAADLDRWAEENPPTPQWQIKLRGVGYTGEFELGAMIDALPLRYDDAGFYLYGSGNLDGRWLAGYEDSPRPILKASRGQSREEAVANLMIEHPELWRK